MSTPVIGNIRKEWDWVKVGIQKILDGQPHLAFRPEDVYVECVTGVATLFIDEHKNFAVTMIETNKYTNENTFLIWLAWCSGKGLRHNSFRDLYVPFFEEVARDCKCDFIEVRSSLDKSNEYYINNDWVIDTRVFTRAL